MGENHSGDDAPAKGSKRFFKLAGMTASVATTFAKTRIRGAFRSKEKKKQIRQESHAKIGERIAKTLGELKGAAMKLGQMASLGADVLPAEIGDALRILQKEAPPMSFDVISDQIESELGSPPGRLFERFDPEPFAAASIGQVHRAKTDDGREVIVKVQYPGVDKSVDSDLGHLKLALRASGVLKINRKAIDGLFVEIRDRLHEELDYCNEADNVRLFRQHHHQHPYVVVPDVVGERSAQRVLTLTFEDGDSINDLDAASYPQDVRDRIGANLFKLTLSQMFDLQAIHADPNPANFAFRPDGTIVLYDFGCVKKLKPEIMTAYAYTVRSGIDANYDGVEKGLLALGARNPEGPPVEPEYYAEWRDILLGPFIGDGPFDYGTAKVHDEIRKMVPGIFKRLASFQPPVEVVFIDRVVGGHYWNMRKVRSRGRFIDLVEPYLAQHARPPPLESKAE